MPVPAVRWSACESPLKPVAAPGELTTGKPAGAGGWSVALAEFDRAGFDAWCANSRRMRESWRRSARMRARVRAELADAAPGPAASRCRRTSRSRESGLRCLPVVLGPGPWARLRPPREVMQAAVLKG